MDCQLQYLELEDTPILLAGSKGFTPCTDSPSWRGALQDLCREAGYALSWEACVKARATVGQAREWHLLVIRSYLGPNAVSEPCIAVFGLLLRGIIFCCRSRSLQQQLLRALSPEPHPRPVPYLPWASRP